MQSLYLKIKWKIVVVAGKEVTGVSDENGVIKWSNIPYGDYQIFETKAPTYTKEDGTKASYQLLKDPIDVKISENNQTVKLTIENNKSGWVLPVTGGIGTTLFTVIGLTLMVTAAFVFFRKSLLIIKILGTCNYGKRGEENASLFSIFKHIQRWKYETKSCFGRYFLFGLGVLLYPTISNWLATRAHYSEISSYDKKIKELQKKEVERREKKQPNIINKFKLPRKHLLIHFLKK